MREFVTDAIVLNTEPTRELDTRFSFFTKDYGKLEARGRSARKILSKLSGHFQLGNIVTARFVEKRGLQVVDGLKRKKSDLRIPDLYHLHCLLGEGDPDEELWNLLVSGKFSWERALEVLGWDPRHAWCILCGNRAPAAFSLKFHDFLCAQCSSRVRTNEVVLLNGL